MGGGVVNVSLHVLDDKKFHTCIPFHSKNMKNVYVCTVSDGFSSTASKFKNPPEQIMLHTCELFSVKLNSRLDLM